MVGKIVEIITFAWNKGCAMRILGHNNLYHLQPCISLILGDEPAQEEICGGCLTRRNCTYCVCKVTEVQIYREGNFGERNSGYIKI